MNKRKFVKLLIILVTIFLLIVSGCSLETGTPAESMEEPLKKVRMGIVEQVQMGNPLVVEAEILPSQRADVYAEVHGTVKKMNGELGSMVESNFLLLSLGQDELALSLEKGKVMKEKTVLQQSKAEADQVMALQQAENGLKKAQLQYDSTLREYSRLKDLLNEAKVTEAELERVQDQLELATLDLELAQLFHKNILMNETSQLMEKAKKEADLAYKEIVMYQEKLNVVAPIAGVIVAWHPYMGQKLAPGQLIAQIENHHPLHVQAQITERELLELKNQTQMNMLIPVYNETVKADIQYISPASQGQGFIVKLSIDNEKGELRPGMSAQLILNADLSQHVLTVPISAVQEERGIYSIFAVENERAIRKEIQIGRTNKEHVEVVSGLQEGDTIVIIGAGLLEDQDRVEIVN